MPGYIASMSPAVKTILELMASWPAEDQEELSELAREIEARRTGVYRLSEEDGPPSTPPGAVHSRPMTRSKRSGSAAAWHEAAIPRAGARRHRRHSSVY
jgi:hypothetical protein